MNIEEAFKTVRMGLQDALNPQPYEAALDCIEAEVARLRAVIQDAVAHPTGNWQRLWAAAKHFERAEQRCQGCEDAPLGQHTGPHDYELDAVVQERDTLRTRCRIAEQEETRLTAERDALKYDVENMTAKFDQMQQERDSFGHQNATLRGERDAFKAALEELARVEGGMAVHGNETVRIARQALAKLRNRQTAEDWADVKDHEWGRGV